MSAGPPAGTLAMTPSVEGSYTSNVLRSLASTNLPSMYIWYEVTSGFRVLPRAVAVLVIGPPRAAGLVSGIPAGISGQSTTETRKARRYTTPIPGRRALPCLPRFRDERPWREGYAATISRDGRSRTL